MVYSSDLYTDYGKYLGKAHLRAVGRWRFCDWWGSNGFQHELGNWYFIWACQHWNKLMHINSTALIYKKARGKQGLVVFLWGGSSPFGILTHILVSYEQLSMFNKLKNKVDENVFSFCVENSHIHNILPNLSHPIILELTVNKSFKHL